MLFSELYGAYYNTVAAILTDAVAHPDSNVNIKDTIEKRAFGESLWAITDAIKEERWQVLKTDGITPIKNQPTMPLTILQKRWLKAIAMDPRIKLFGHVDFDFPDVDPLFLPSDYIIFDKYSDGDDFTDEKYIVNFRMILDAIEKKYPLIIGSLNRKGALTERVVYPEYLEYSEKDDKFRLIGGGDRFGSTNNLGRIISCRPWEGQVEETSLKGIHPRPRKVIFELTDERNALERVLLHFAHFEKSAERIGEDKYLITINYDKEDETEMVIRILSFGPMIRVTAPSHFISLIKQRLIDQKSCEQ